jgi:hypothetical protein
METPARAAMSLIVGVAPTAAGEAVAFVTRQSVETSKRFDPILRAYGRESQAPTHRTEPYDLGRGVRPSSAQMTSLLEPPPLIALALVLGAAAGVLLLSMRGARHPALGMSEQPGAWGAEDPPVPAKRAYMYLADRPPEVVEGLNLEEPTRLRVNVIEAGEAAAASSEVENVDLPDEPDDQDEPPSLADLYRSRRRAEDDTTGTDGGSASKAASGTAVDRTAEEER